MFRAAETNCTKGENELDSDSIQTCLLRSEKASMNRPIKTLANIKIDPSLCSVSYSERYLADVYNND